MADLRTLVGIDVEHNSVRRHKHRRRVDRWRHSLAGTEESILASRKTPITRHVGGSIALALHKVLDQWTDTARQRIIDSLIRINIGTTKQQQFLKAVIERDSENYLVLLCCVSVDHILANYRALGKLGSKSDINLKVRQWKTHRTIDEALAKVSSETWTLSETDFFFLSEGCGILGCGGGGDPYPSFLSALSLLQQGEPIYVVVPTSIPAGAAVPAVGFMGSPNILSERFPSGRELKNSAQSVMHYHGEASKALFGVISLEIGGSNGSSYMLPNIYNSPRDSSCRMDTPVIDANLMGRAYPNLWQTTLTRAGIPMTPCAVSDAKGEQDNTLATVPDLITVLDSQTGSAVGTQNYLYGLHVFIIALVASPQWSDEDELKVGGPAAFQTITPVNGLDDEGSKVQEAAGVTWWPTFMIYQDGQEKWHAKVPNPPDQHSISALANALETVKVKAEKTHGT
ncbi:hypothetical protein UA08_06943 [Talaromyces atroroseus]|uniref:S-Me-THD N-terminal domain-containing protein n=1 Tax=Talaromyces atroroseus TaxID=1441469 RepID=A0A225AW01_TALAT|nr:hypothetical protein UA08_06943 [Talaromyces atroroseus]OKL57667.1 hypothetical protein UA08_06943 [Talaromyces atroroseus]